MAVLSTFLSCMGRNTFLAVIASHWLITQMAVRGSLRYISDLTPKAEVA